MLAHPQRQFGEHRVQISGAPFQQRGSHHGDLGTGLFRLCHQWDAELARVAPNAFSELGMSPGAVPEMQNFNRSPILVQTVVDVKRRMEKPPELRVSFYGSADVREGLKQFEVVEKIIRKLPGRFGMLLPRPLENFFQIG